MATETIRPTIHLKKPQAFLSFLDAPPQDVLEFNEFLTIGRDSSNQFQVKDPSISSRHARIEWRNGIYVIRDLRSRNGTSVNGARIMEAPLYHSDRIRIGNSELLFSTERDKRSHTLASTSKNPAWNTKLKSLPEMSRSELSILIGGPSGTGKEILARRIHELSGRREGPFVSVNCSAMADSLIESELFGHAKGSFTDATHDRKGAFESARGGTLFLDEIGDLPLHLQPKLLRALDNREIRPVGADRTLTTDVRIVAATHHVLKEKVALGEFRIDLYFRINILSIRAPALRNRMEDFEDLLYHFAREFKVAFSVDAIERLKKHHWPGNIRELRNVVARGKALCRDRVNASDVDNLLDHLPDDFGLITTSHPFSQVESPSRNVMKDLERSLIEKRLLINRGNQRKTAQDLGLPKSTLHDRIKSYRIDVHSLMSRAEEL